ncbi:hypothetical protein ACPXCE_07415 [Streptomyces sp. DT24]|uniref:hypothetical protein n=1 Tax=unclassified Streptomyces TaxID=2593676 RepID=UPI0023B9876A|nr:hypothetical protein [Streptomyces sp. AM 4-1-1]WEH33299.1 hypothetical protein PZB75_07845 [Streptomyces sp. AM 4-1-1]
MDCVICENLTAGLTAAEAAGDASMAVDCRVLLRRHPQHDDVPVPAENLLSPC